MYKIFSDNSLLGYVENPTYIYLNPNNGCYNATTKDKATGIVFNGEVYNLEGTSGLDKPNTALIVEVDSGEVVVTQRTSVEQTITDLMIENIYLQQEIDELKSKMEGN